MSSTRRKQPESELESDSCDWESLKLWSTNDSSSRLNHLIEREALSATAEDRTSNHTTSHSQWIYLVGALIPLVLSSFSYWFNSSQIQQAFHEVRTEVYSNYVYLIRPDKK